VPVTAYEPGLHDVTVDNPSPRSDTEYSCESVHDGEPARARVRRRPVVDDVEPSPICTAQNAYTLTVNGENFVVDTRGDSTGTPTVTINGTEVTFEAPTDPSTAESCVETDIDGVYSCTAIEVAADGEPPARDPQGVTSNDVHVNNPPEQVDCRSEKPGTLLDAPPPQVTSATIQKACAEGDDTMVVEGDFHFGMDENVDRLPSVEVTGPEGNTATFDGSNGNLQRGGECSDALEDASAATEHCAYTSFDLGGTLNGEGGDYEIVYNNPETVECSVTETLTVQTDTPDKPVIGSVEEDAICGLGDTLTINGQNFKEMATVSLGGEQADSVSVSDDGTQIEATWLGAFDPTADPTITLSVTNPDNCSVTTELSDTDLEIVGGPIAVFLDPPVHYDQTEIRGRLFVSGGTGRQTSNVQIRRNSGDATRDLTFDNANQNSGELSPLLPDEDPQNAGNPLPATAGTGDHWDVRVTETVTGTECGAWIEDLLVVTDSKNLALTGIEPQYGDPNEETSVRITAKENGNLAGNEVNFESTPRAYLSPTSNVTNASKQDTVELSGVTFLSATEIRGHVPSGLNPGAYDVVVVNPDEEVGVLSGAFTVTDPSQPPPEIDSVNPGSWDTSQSALSVEVVGSDFRSGVSASLTCDTSSTGTVISSASRVSGTELDMTIDASQLDTGDVCELTVTNQNGSSASFSPIGTVEPGFGSIDFRDASASWNQARRWPAMSTGIPGSQQRFVYALGGDDGSGTLRQDGEFGPIGRFGDIETWSVLPYTIPNGGRTFTRAVRIRDFVYLVGGRDGSGTTGDIHRANVLDPSHNPDITGLEFNFVDPSNDGVAPGDYFYRVSVVHDSNSPHNPGGETIPSDVQPVSIPDLGGRFSVQVTISWDASALSDIDEVRIYRTENPNGALGDGKLLDTVRPGTTSYTDDDTASFSSDQPIAVGALGQWHGVGQTLNTPRERHAVRGLIHPDDANSAYIYVLGGDNSSGSRLDSIERVEIGDPDPTVPRTQSVTGVTDLTATDGSSLSDTVVEPEAMIATPTNSDNLSSGEAWLYATGGAGIGGAGGSTNPSSNVEGWEITNTDGDLGSRNSYSDMISGRAGHVGIVANNHVGNFGGPTGSSENTTDSSSAITSGTGDVGNWNSLSNINMDPRYQMGRTPLNGFLYIGGGVDNAGTTYDTVEYSVVGATSR